MRVSQTKRPWSAHAWRYATTFDYETSVCPTGARGRPRKAVSAVRAAAREMASVPIRVNSTWVEDTEVTDETTAKKQRGTPGYYCEGCRARVRSPAPTGTPDWTGKRTARAGSRQLHDNHSSTASPGFHEDWRKEAQIAFLNLIKRPRRGRFQWTPTRQRA